MLLQTETNDPCFIRRVDIISDMILITKMVYEQNRIYQNTKIAKITFYDRAVFQVSKKYVMSGMNMSDYGIKIGHGVHIST